MSYSKETFSVQCLHESKGISADIEVPDYEPLSLDEVAEFMIKATSTTDFRLRTAIQVRLDKAIPGMTCPRPIEGPIAEKEAEIDELYVNEIKNGRTQEFMGRYSEIMNRGKQNISKQNSLK